jgi:hypothetical protein
VAAGPTLGGFALSQVQLDGMPYRELPKEQLFSYDLQYTESHQG